jgi:hypothetical protein
MAIRSSRLPPEPDPAQVWRGLAAHLKQQAISVVAQMAFNVVKTQPMSFQQESDDDHPAQLTQAPQ